MSEMETYKISRSNGRDLIFTGTVLASVHDRNAVATIGIAPEARGWTQLILYKTLAGNYIVEKIGGFGGDDFVHTREARVCTTIDHIFDYVGWSGLAKELYDKAEIDYVEYVE